MKSLPGRLFLRNLIERRNLLFELVRRDFQQRFVGTAAGWLWSVIHPLVLLASWVFVFEVCHLRPSLTGQATQNYTLYLFCGVLPWLLFQDTVQRSASCIVENANLITKTVFPSEVIPISVFLSSVVTHVFGVSLAIVAVAIWEKHLGFGIVLLPFYVALIGLLAVGVGWIASSLQVYLRDTAQVVTVLLTFWFWTTPIFILESQIPEKYRFIVNLNPLTYVVRAYRERFFTDQLPALHDTALLAVFACMTFVAGGLFFRQLKRGFGDVL